MIRFRLQLLVSFTLLISVRTSAAQADDSERLAPPWSQKSVSAPSLSQPPDPGPVMLRCVGADGVFSFDESSDDFVGWAYPVEPVVLSNQIHAVYGFEALPPVGQRCRIFRAPFPGGVEPPPPPPPPPPDAASRWRIAAIIGVDGRCLRRQQQPGGDHRELGRPDRAAGDDEELRRLRPAGGDDRSGR